MNIKRGLYYEEFELNKTVRSQGRTITQADIVNFAGFTGDYSELHVNEELAAASHFKRPIAHGMLGMSVATGLAILTGVLDNTIIAFEGIDEWSFKRPVFTGDTIYCDMTNIKKEERILRGGLRAGHITMQVDVIKGPGQGKVCQSGIWKFLVKIKNNL